MSKLLHIRDGWCVVPQPNGQVKIQKRRPQGGEPDVAAWEVEHELEIAPVDLAELVLDSAAVNTSRAATPAPTLSKSRRITTAPTAKPRAKRRR